MAAKRKSDSREAWNRFADVGRGALVLAATLLPARKRATAARLNAAATLLSVRLVAKLLKHAIPERRPDGEDDKSFPSEHAAECTAAAMIIEREYSSQVALVAYGLAVAVSAARIKSRKHYPHDVAGGAVIGCIWNWVALQLRLAIERRMADAIRSPRPSDLPLSRTRVHSANAGWLASTLLPASLLCREWRIRPFS